MTEEVAAESRALDGYPHRGSPWKDPETPKANLVEICPQVPRTSSIPR